MSAIAGTTDRPDSPPEGMTDGEMREVERLVAERVAEKLGDSDWWNALLFSEDVGVNPITAEIATVLSRCAINALAVSRAKGRGLELLDMGTAIAMNRFMLTIAKQYAEAEAREELEDIPDYLENV